MLPFDLHVLGLPPAFNLSHDQTLQLRVPKRTSVICVAQTIAKTRILLRVCLSENLSFPAQAPTRIA